MVLAETSSYGSSSWDKRGQSESAGMPGDRLSDCLGESTQETGRQGEMEGDTPTARLGSGLIVSGSQAGPRGERAY